jgi:uncharacterized membrane protein
MMDGYGMSGWGWLGMAAMLIVGIALVTCIVWVVTARRPAAPYPQQASVRELLDASLARGEITPGEYRERLDALRPDAR